MHKGKQGKKIRGTYASEGDLRLQAENFGAAAHEVEGLAQVTAAEEAAEVVECRSTAWPYPGPGWLRSRTWRVDGGPVRLEDLP